MTKTAIMAENKLILLYLIYQLDMPISWADLLDFAVPNYMDYMDFQIYLQEMVENGIVEKLNEDNGYFYSITEDCTQCIRYFSKRIPESKLGSILAYVRKNKSRIKKEYSVYANYFYYAENEYIVKCGIIEDDAPLIELNLTVASKDQAKLIRKNWKSNVSNIYNTILQSLITNNSPTSNDDEDEDTTQSWYNDMLFREVSEALQKNLNISESEAERKLYTEGLKIYSAMDPTAQSIAQKKVLQWKTPKDKKLECGYIMMGLDGRVLATIGSRKEKDGLFLFDRANGAYLQPGSTIKPIAVYAPAIEEE